MSVYQDRILPHLTNLTMRQRNLVAYRRRVISAAEGRVLEVGVGSGLNLPLYTDKARQVIGLNPSPRLLAMARRAGGKAPIPVKLLEGSAEALPLDDQSIDTVVTTWTLCTIPEATRALSDMRRVLTPGSCLLFVEPGRSPDENVRRWQDRLTPLWKRIGGGCHLNRAIDELIGGAGFRIERLQQGNMTGPKLMTFMYEGCARSA